MSVLATDLLARPGAGDLAVIGTGVQARAHIRAFSQTRELRRIRVAGRSRPGRRFAAELARDRAGHRLRRGGRGGRRGGHHRHRDQLGAAGAAARLDPGGAHVNAVGACLPAARELDGATVAAAALFATAGPGWSESGDYLLAVAEGLAGPGHSAASWARCWPARRPAGPATGRSRCSSRSGWPSRTWPPRCGPASWPRAAGAGQWVSF